MSSLGIFMYSSLLHTYSHTHMEKLNITVSAAPPFLTVFPHIIVSIHANKMTRNNANQVLVRSADDTAGVEDTPTWDSCFFCCAHF